MAETKKRSLLIICTASFALMLPAFVAWLVNIEAAVNTFLPSWHLLSDIIPANIFILFNKLSLDLSTVSTLVPLMMLAFLFVQTFRVLKQLKNNPAFAHQLEADPYPPHFGFFLVMLGLAGTLYGLLIGLNISGVANLAEQGPSAESIRASLDRLLAGTATALLSSLVGLVGAFFVAKPIPWMFRRIAGIEADESRRTLSETVERLTEDMRALSKASRTFAEHLHPKALEGLFDRFDHQETAVNELTKKVSTAVTHLAGIQDAQTEANKELQKIELLEKAIKTVLVSSEKTNKYIEQLCSEQQQTNRLLGELNADNGKRHQNSQQALEILTATAKDGQNNLKKNQDAMRKALALYASNK